MLRHLAIIAALSAGPCFAETIEITPTMRDMDPFVTASDECGAARYAHLVGESFVVHRTSLPKNAMVHGPADQRVIDAADLPSTPSLPLTLEYRPQRLNVVLDDAARIISIGCH